MTLYHILIDFGGGLDLKGKISASLAIRKMIERLSNEYESRVRSVQDTKCEIDLSSPADDLTNSLRSMLEGMAGGMNCRIEIESAAGGEEGSSVFTKASASPAQPTPLYFRRCQWLPAEQIPVEQAARPCAVPEHEDDPGQNPDWSPSPDGTV